MVNYRLQKSIQDIISNFSGSNTQHVEKFKVLNSATKCSTFDKIIK